MTPFRILFLFIAACSVAACSNPQVASRNASAAPQTASVQAVGTYMPNAKIANVTVTAPQSLTVSEKNSYFPRADIVWRGDTLGNRHRQIEDLLRTSVARLSDDMNGIRPVNVHIEITRFHGLSEKARYSTGGVHNINFILTLTDPATGTVIRGPREIVTNLDAFGGEEAIAADARGETQKVRVTAFLTEVLRAEFLNPGGYQDTNSGFFVALNKS